MGNLDTTVLVATISGVLFPAYVVLTSKQTIRKLEEKPDRLTSVYRETNLLLLVMGFLVLFSLAIEQIPLTTIGLGFIYSPLWVLLLVVGSVAAFWLIKKIEIPCDKVESVGKSFEGVQHILPKNLREYKWMVATAFVAGVFEEIIFRGFLVWVLQIHVHIVVAIVVVNILFGIAHATTKRSNAIKAFGLGVLFSLLYYFTGSLWLPILAHIVVDLYAATFSYKFFQIKDSA